MAVISGALVMAGCQAHSSSPTHTMTVSGNYKAVAECFYLKVRSEGYWKKDDLDSMNTTRIILGTNIADVGRVDFVGIAPDRTQVTFLIPHPDKRSQHVQACASGG